MPKKQKIQTKGKKRKKKRGRKSGKGRKRRHRTNNNPSSPVLSIDDMPGLARSAPSRPNLYRRWEGLPREDSFFQRWLVTTPPDDPSFGRLGGDRAIRLLLSDSAPIISKEKISKEKPTQPQDSDPLLPPIESATNLQDLFKNDFKDDSPLPTSWLQRQTIQPGSGSRRGMYKTPQGTSDEFMCSECEISVATSLCRTCEQMFCLECCTYLHRARMKGLIGHTIVENVKEVVPQEKLSVPFADIKVLSRYNY